MYEYFEVEPVTKKEELMTLLKDYAPEIHTNKDKEYDYLEDEYVCITILNKDGKEMFIDLEDEFTLTFCNWHTHYSAEKAGYNEFRTDILSILNNEQCAFIIECNGEWMGSSLQKGNVKKDDAIILAKRWLNDKWFIKKMKKYGVVIHCNFWNSEFNREINILPNEF